MADREILRQKGKEFWVVTQRQKEKGREVELADIEIWRWEVRSSVWLMWRQAREVKKSSLTDREIWRSEGEKFYVIGMEASE